MYESEEYQDYQSKLNRWRNYNTMKTRKVDVKITNPDKSIVFQKDSFEVPESWSDRAATIVASKYAMDNESSAVGIIDRVVNQITAWGVEQRYFNNTEETGTVVAERFMDKLKNILINQKAAFNSPVWFNVGVPENDNQVAGCFIYGVEDNMDDILAHSVREGKTFKSGSGAGVNISKIRAKGELLSNRGVASGPVSFMRIWDQVAGSIKSGGKTRRSAKMVIMDVDHPDIMEFIECKSHEEKKAQELIAAGVPVEEAYQTVAFQNANHSIMVTDAFMRAVENDEKWDLINRGNKEVARTVRAKELFRKISEIAWETGDPGIQFYDKINKYNPVPSLGNINCSNPCAEHVAINGSACNLASINLVKYMCEDGSFDNANFCNDVFTIITAQDIMIDMADYPTEQAKQVAIETRPLGLGFTNLGAYLMLKGIPYESDEAIKEVEFITSLMTTAAYSMSIKLAEKKGSYKYFDNNLERNLDIIYELTKSRELCDSAVKYGLRNSQVTLLAPTGTISFLMDCDSTGIEPLFALKSYKQLAGGGVLEMLPKCVETAINKLQPADVWNADTAINIVIPSLKNEEKAIFKTANEIKPINHIRIMAASQKYINGAISKTVNMPNESTVEDVEEIYIKAWKEGLKSIAIYRDGSKQMQPMVTKLKYDAQEEKIEEDTVTWSAIRKRLPDTRTSATHKFNVGGFEGYLTVGFYEDGVPGEIFIRSQKQGSTMMGILDSFATAVSLGLQYGVPLETFIDKFKGNKFEPSGFTPNPEIRFAHSIMDYLFRWMENNLIDEEDTEPYTEEVETPVLPTKVNFDGPPCPKCGSMTMSSGTCYVCTQCGETTGCS